MKKFVILCLTIAFFCSEGKFWGEAAEICAEKVTLSISNKRFNLPYVSNKSLLEADPAVDRVVFVLPGSDRDANFVFNNGFQALKTLPVSENVLLISPQFLSEEDADSAQDNCIRWRGSDWSAGLDSKSPSQISSFEVLNEFILALLDTGHFPNVRTLVVAGHSAGGQFVNRFAAGSKPLQDGLSGRKIAVLFVISNPSSYLYFDEKRPKNAVESLFVAPDPKLYPKYDNYRYGLKALSRYMQNVGRENIKKYYKTANIRYLLGGSDTDENHKDLSKTPGAMSQGRQRLERGLLYYAYTLEFFNNANRANHILKVVPGVGHSSKGIFNSQEGKEALFGGQRR